MDEAHREVLTAMLRERGGRSRLRVLQVVCQHQRELVEVIRVERTDYAIYRAVQVREQMGYSDPPREDDGEWRTVGLKHRVGLMDANLEESDPNGWLMATTNRCCAKRIDVSWLKAQLARPGKTSKRLILGSDT